MRYRLLTLIEAEGGRNIMDRFHGMTGVSCALTETDGQILLVSNSKSQKYQFKNICSKFHLQHPGSRKHCSATHIRISKDDVEDEGYSFHQCENGLIEGVIPVFCNDVHVVTLVTDPFFLSSPDAGHFRRQAEYYSYDVGTYLEAVAEVPVLVRETINHGMVFLKGLAERIETALISQR